MNAILMNKETKTQLSGPILSSLRVGTLPFSYCNHSVSKNQPFKTRLLLC